MSSSRGTKGIISAYRQYKTDARGWGIPTFADFRARLWPLRDQNDRAQWPDDDMLLVMELQEAGAGWALQRFFTTRHGTNPVAAEVLGAEGLKPEIMSQGELDSHMRALIRDCLKNEWAPGEFGAFIRYLDGDKTPADLAGGKDAGPGPEQGSPADAFAEMYRSAGEGFRRRVRAVLASAAEKGGPARSPEG